MTYGGTNRAGAERRKRSAPACRGWRAGVRGSNPMPGPHSHLLDITLSFRHRARLSDAGRTRRGATWLPLEDRRISPPPGRQPPPEGPGSVHWEIPRGTGPMMGSVSAVRLLMPSRSRSGLAGSACVLVWDHASASTKAVGSQNDEGPPGRQAALRRKACRRKPR